jgi:hypothetical protein
MQPLTLDQLKAIAPTIGRVYAPSTHPIEPIYIEDVGFVDADEDSDACFFVNGCDPQDAGNEGGNGLELHSDEWIEHGYHLIR